MTTENQIGGGSNNSMSNPYLGIVPLTPDLAASLEPEVTVCPDPRDCPIPQEVADLGSSATSSVTVCPDPRDCPISTEPVPAALDAAGPAGTPDITVCPDPRDCPAPEAGPGDAAA